MNRTSRVLFYLIGLLLLTFGIAATVVSRLGTSPFDAVLVGLHEQFGLTVGSWEYILGATLLACNAVANRGWPEWLAFLTAIVTGLGIDLWLWVLQAIGEPTSLWAQGLLLAAGIAFTSIGIATYLQSDFAPSPFDRTMLILQQKLGVRLSTAKNILMVTFLLLALLVRGPIGIGTLLMVATGGWTIGACYAWLERLRRKAEARSHIPITAGNPKEGTTTVV